MKYRPLQVKDAVLDKDVRRFFDSFIEGDSRQSILLSGSPGIGKTTLANAVCNDIEDSVVLFLNASEERGIDTIRNKVMQFGSTKSLQGDIKIVVLDEADSLTHDAQKALRGVIEDVAVTTIFILTANYPGKLIDPLVSRCHHIPVNFKDKKDAMKQMAIRCADILKRENIQTSNAAISRVVKSKFPDFRDILNTLQYYSASGSFDVDNLDELKSTNVDALVAVMLSLIHI